MHVEIHAINLSLRTLFLIIYKLAVVYFVMPSIIFIFFATSQILMSVLYLMVVVIIIAPI